MLTQLKDGLKEMPGVRRFRQKRYRRYFERHGSYNLFHGVYGSFEEAVSDAPAGDIGYDNPGPAAMYDDQLDQTWPDHYPVLTCLGLHWADYRHVLDFGGHRGALFYAAQRLFGPGPEWTVFDVPQVVAEGRRTAETRGAPIRFEDDLDRVEVPDLVIAAGSLQYVEDSVDEWLGRIGPLPRHLIVSATPFHDHREFVTLNNMGTAVCPYKVRHYGPFVDALRVAGYRPFEEWRHLGKACVVPFHVPAWEVTYRGGLFLRD